MAKNEPQSPPLYYVLSWFWFKLFGYSVVVSRSLAAVISTLTLPAIYWLSRELFSSNLTAKIAVMLIAVSPFHLFYAQEARPFSLWILMVLASSALFLRTIRIQTLLSWSFYTGVSLLSLYTFPFSLFVVFGHGLYLVGINGLRFTRSVKAYLLSSIASVFLFSPWLFFIVKNSDEIDPWRAADASLGWLARKWAANLGLLFFDPNLDIGFSLLSFTLPVLFCCALVGYALSFASKQSSKAGLIFVLVLIIPITLALVSPDLILGGRRSSIARYFVPCYLGIHLAVASLFSAKILSRDSSDRKIFGGIGLVTILMGTLSCFVISQSQAWPTKPRVFSELETARIVNASDRPLLIGDKWGYYGLMSLSYLLKPETQVKFVEDYKTMAVEDGFSDVFLIAPIPELGAQLIDEHPYSLEPMLENKKLLRLTEDYGVR